MLAWINAVLAQRSDQPAYDNVTNFTTDWNDGTALLEVKVEIEWRCVKLRSVGLISQLLSRSYGRFTTGLL